MGIRGMVRQRLRGQVPVQLLGKHTETFVLQPPESHISQGKQEWSQEWLLGVAFPLPGTLEERPRDMAVNDCKLTRKDRFI